MEELTPVPGSAYFLPVSRSSRNRANSQGEGRAVVALNFMPCAKVSNSLATVLNGGAKCLSSLLGVDESSCDRATKCISSLENTCYLQVCSIIHSFIQKKKYGLDRLTKL